MTSADSSATKDDSMIPTMLASAFAGVIARFPCHPIDTAKARMQTQTWLLPDASRKTYRHFVDALKTIARTEGLRGLYRGFGLTALGSAPASCLYFTSYEAAKGFLSKDREQGSVFYVHFASGMFAETVSCVLWVPIDVLKERMQIQRVPGKGNGAGLSASKAGVFYETGFQAIRETVRNEGVLGFYRGYGATLMSFGPFSALYFMFYEEGKGLMKLSESNAQTSYVDFFLYMLCGAGAGAAASFLTNPLDLVKLRLQVQRSGTGTLEGYNVVNPKVRYKHLGDGLVKLYQYEGLSGYVKGSGARMAFHAPSTAIIIAIFEQLKIFFRNVYEA